jgi:hypothetical protein
MNSGLDGCPHVRPVCLQPVLHGGETVHTRRHVMEHLLMTQSSSDFGLTCGKGEGSDFTAKSLLRKSRSSTN